MVSQDCYNCLGKSRSTFLVLYPVGFLVQPRNLLVHVPNGLSASEDLVKQRIGEGFGLAWGDVRVFCHALRKRFQDCNLLLACVFLRLKFLELGFEVSDWV